MRIEGKNEKANKILKALVEFAPSQFEAVEATKARKVLIDPGHSESEPGARSNSGAAEEEDLNRIQAEAVAAELRAAGHQVDIYDPEVDNISEIGRRAVGYDLFLSLHHNSYDGESDPGCEVFVPLGSYARERSAAQLVSGAISKAIRCTNRGVKEANFTVIREASKVSNAIVMLVESYFLNPYDAESAKKRSLVAADAIADALLVVLSSSDDISSF